MPVKLICASHSPLMEFASPQRAEQETNVRAAFEKMAAEVKAFDPTLIITFGPDHFNGFFYDLMPSFCVGIRATAAGDWNYGAENNKINVPEETALHLVRRVLDEGVDVAYSYRMQADHGVTQPLHFLCDGQLDRYPTIPVFINGAAAPMPTTKRTVALGRAIGQFIKSLNLENERVLILGTGGLSHDPPTPQMGSVPPEVEEFLIAGRNPSTEARHARQAKIIAVGQKLAAGDTSVAVPLNAAWDIALLETFKNADFAAIEAMTEADIRRDGGRGGQEVRSWIAAFAALSELGEYHMTTQVYEAISEWIAGFGIVSAELKN
ncbi:3-carboxyethylcatechol 2,3-dioxygenase [Acinetobacter bohemicus]|uniref:3-carboxyethylcatechol 2,3-dioxygenase n=1 Tax=Acinetobacter bohemicus TaxID=1435036 RepID=A0A1I6PLS6_9GAMM|nr:3-carboxyethylcatechol 2,3-dioxygenase [Acinetobacter bohemicus]KAB0654650.1 3-carboxyethylcatechol 2,3-dioxygenase [Acinetobacter bohemicus]SFS41090.1 2,3-dihydroxyphenylpropionate 1,2-dioxygenase [Acinetobacter bohemicus]